MAGTHVQLAGTADQIRMLAGIYGDPLFWHQVIAWDTEAINLRRALLFLIHGRTPPPIRPLRSLLCHRDSRVRALACSALGHARDRGSCEQLELLASDPSLRVRVAAKKALEAIPVPCPLLPVLAHGPRAIMRVIVSDDSPHNAEMYGRLIRNLGCQVAVARTEAETLTEARRTPPDLVVTDNQKWRDNSSGLRMTEELARDPDLSEIVVIMASADPIEAAFLWNGGDHFIHKPFGGPDQVRRLVQEYLC